MIILAAFTLPKIAALILVGIFLGFCMFWASEPNYK
jgi:hypothetical protein